MTNCCGHACPPGMARLVCPHIFDGSSPASEWKPVHYAPYENMPGPTDWLCLECFKSLAWKTDDLESRLDQLIGVCPACFELLRVGKKPKPPSKFPWE